MMVSLKSRVSGMMSKYAELSGNFGNTHSYSAVGLFPAGGCPVHFEASKVGPGFAKSAAKRLGGRSKEPTDSGIALVVSDFGWGCSILEPENRWVNKAPVLNKWCYYYPA
jgi:hypothetical protein